MTPWFLYSESPRAFPLYLMSNYSTRYMAFTSMPWVSSRT